MDNRMSVGEAIDVPVEYYSLSYLIGIIEIITPFYIIAYVVPDDYFIRITGQIYVGQNIHFNK
jgi:hypothetical protein